MIAICPVPTLNNLESNLSASSAEIYLLGVSSNARTPFGLYSIWVTRGNRTSDFMLQSEGVDEWQGLYFLRFR